jgi:thiol-disulfide isomerase/thioredoxin
MLRGLALNRFSKSATRTALTFVCAGLYGMMMQPGNAQVQAASCAAAQSLTQKLKPLARGEVAGVLVPEKSGVLPALSFKGPDGAALSLENFRGKTVLVNLWATWCAPCRKEMPALDKLQAELGGADFEVVTINIDQRNLERPKTFLTEIGVNKLAYYHDASAKVFTELKAADRAFGMPTTLLIDPKGCELGFLSGPAEWASEDALKLLRAALGR